MIADAIRQARRIHRAVMEQTYDGTCTVYEVRRVRNPDTKAMEETEEEVFSNVPCHLSFSGSSAAGKSDPAAPVSQTIKLFLAPEHEIRPGSKLVVAQNGRTECYSRSGVPAVYDSHQEITLELWKERA